jgi:mono/diheme cytochrome c family protein
VKTIGLCLLTAGLALAATLPPEIRDVFAKAQCAACHNDNGVGSSTRLKFPADEAGEPAFLRSLEPLVNRAHPAESRLIQMPTARLAHPGGERIKRGSAEESAVLAWIAKLPAPTAAAPEARRARQTVLRRLTNSQYNQTVADILGDQTQPARQFPTEDFVQGFTNSAEGQSISPLLVEAYARSAARLARNAARGGKLPACKDAPCLSRFVRTFGKSAFRRPLNEEEAARFTKLGDPQIIVEAMLQSPDFLFRSEPGDYGAASRLSYLLWNTVPDAPLTHAADAGLLHEARQVEAAARRLLADPRAHASLDEFAGQWLRFDRVRNAIRERRLFPEFGTELAAAMTEETSRLFQHLVWNNQDFRELFRADYTFVNSSLAQLYGLTPPEREFSMVKFAPGTRRGGILGHASFLTMTSKPEETSPTERGLFVREHFLCQIVPPPPPGVNTTLPTLMEEKPMSNRERLGIHLSNPSCAGCHRLVDPIGFGLEQFDAIGRFREKQVALVFPKIDKRKNQGTRREGVPVEIPVDTTASIVGLPNSDFRSAAEAGRILADSAICQRCVVKQYFRYAMNRAETAADQPAIDAIFDRFRKSGFRFQELILGVVTSGPFLEEFVHAK